MEFNIKTGIAAKQRSACVVVAVFDQRKLSAEAKQLDEIAEGFIGKIVRSGDMDGKCGQVLLLHHVPKLACDRLLLVGCGREHELGDTQYRTIVANAVQALLDTTAADAVFYLSDLSVRERNFGWKIRELVLASNRCSYRFDLLKSSNDKDPIHLKKITINVSKRNEQTISEQNLQQAVSISAGIQLSKDLGNLPANICTPSYLAEQAQSIAKNSDKMTAQVLGPQKMQQLKMEALLSVAKGSRQEPRLIILNYAGGTAKDAPVVLVGKGITFDSGGISIKPAADMDQMKFDMCGAASVLGTLLATAQMKLKINLIGIIAAAENLPDGQANKPGDIVTSMSGQTIEILNTDAEGRLVLCDSLTYAERFKPACVIDIATLTGSCVVALGKHASGMLCNHDALGEELKSAGLMSGDRIWPLPLWEDYQDQLKSNFADMANIGGRDAGTITAACFLSRFCKKFQWAHLDIAGTAWLSGDQKGATGRPVPLLCQFLMSRADVN